MKNSYKAGIVACSNGLSFSTKEEMKQLKETLLALGIETVWSDCLYAKDEIRNGTGKERADALMDFYKDESVDVIFDVSGGDVSQEVLDYLDYEAIASARSRTGVRKVFWGYSDLTVLLNAIYAKTGSPGVLYQVRYIENMLQPGIETIHGLVGQKTLEAYSDMFRPRYHFLRGTEMSGVVVGGNIRCLLKLAGTEYFPDMTHKILFLEARSGVEKEMRSYLSRLQQMGVFEKIHGLFLGTFTQWDKENARLQGMRTKIQENEICEEWMTMERLVMESIPKDLPVAKTLEVGHASTSKAIWIGKEMNLT